MATRTLTKQQWRRQRFAEAPEGERDYLAYEWLRAAVADLPAKRDPSDAVRAVSRERAHAITQEATDWLAGRANEMGLAADLDVGQVAFRVGLEAALREQSEDRERIRRAYDWFRWAARQLLRRSRRYTVTREQAQAAADLRARVVTEAGEFLAGLARRADGGDRP
jgi:hypothetical protein